MMEKQVDKLSLKELSGLVGIYPWFAAARIALAGKLIAADGWSREELGNMLLHISDPSVLRPLVLPLLAPTEIKTSPSRPSARKRVPGGDFFTREEYDKVRQEDDNLFVRPFTRRTEEQGETAGEAFDFATETLARIYAQQGYFAQAKEIYGKLILAYPEKSAYFAALIEKLNN